jgi:hypothetical protein
MEKARVLCKDTQSENAHVDDFKTNQQINFNSEYKRMLRSEKK